MDGPGRIRKSTLLINQLSIFNVVINFFIGQNCRKIRRSYPPNYESDNNREAETRQAT